MTDLVTAVCQSFNIFSVILHHLIILQEYEQNILTSAAFTSEYFYANLSFKTPHIIIFSYKIEVQHHIKNVLQ